MARASVLDAGIILPDEDDAMTNDLIASVFANEVLFDWSVEIASDLHALNDYDLVARWCDTVFGVEGDYLFDVIDHAAVAAFLREMV